jgi:hypothetical protein
LLAKHFKIKEVVGRVVGNFTKCGSREIHVSFAKGGKY